MFSTLNLCILIISSAKFLPQPVNMVILEPTANRLVHVPNMDIGVNQYVIAQKSLPSYTRVPIFRWWCVKNKYHIDCELEF